MPKKSSQKQEEEILPIEPAYIPEITNNNEVLRVFIEEKSITAYKRPLVWEPTGRLADIKTYRKSNFPTQAGSKLPDVFPELDESTRRYLNLTPFGDNIIINKKQISQLYKFYFESRNLPLPSSTINAFQDHMNLLREILNLSTLDELEEQELAAGYESSYPKYTCKCNEKNKK